MVWRISLRELDAYQYVVHQNMEMLVTINAKTVQLAVYHVLVRCLLSVLAVNLMVRIIISFMAVINAVLAVLMVSIRTLHLISACYAVLAV